MRSFRAVVVALVVASVLVEPGVSTRTQGSPRKGGIEQALRALATTPMVVDAAGLTRSGRRLWTLEPPGGGDRTRPKLVILGGLDGTPASTEAVMRLLGWWFADRQAEALRSRWTIAALPCAHPALCDPEPGPASESVPLVFPPTGGFFDGKLDPTPQYIWRWTTMQAPTVVIEMRAGGELRWRANTLASSLVPGAASVGAGTLAAALAEAGAGAAWSEPAPGLQLEASPAVAVAALRDILARAGGMVSPLRRALLARQSRAPLDVARLLAPKYPAQPIVSYIPALAWSGALRLARMTGDARFRDKPLADMAPFLSGARPAIAEPYLLTSLAGHLAFSDLGEMEGDAGAAALARRAADFIMPQAPGELVRFPRAWTDDMFMATSVLARVAARENDPRYGAAAGRLLATYADRLQRPDGIFMHAKEGPHAWGRGNGFAAFGLMEALTALPATWADRTPVLDSYRALMKGLLAHQAPDGLWRQVVDEPGSYRELTVTAMTIAAMARGVRLGWIDAGTYRRVIDRAWHGLLARIAEDGTLLDVCTGTGSGPTKEYYLNRAAISGADDRGGAMALTAALEMEELVRGVH